MEHLFYLKIENDIHSARVTGAGHQHHLLYHVLFEDGYENIFFTDPETGNWIEEDLGETSLAISFGEKVRQLSEYICLPYKTLSWCRASLGEKLINFGFYVYKEDGQTIFEIYGANHKFLCSLLKTSGNTWKISGDRDNLMKTSGYTEQVKIMITILDNITE